MNMGLRPAEAWLVRPASAYLLLAAAGLLTWICTIHGGHVDYDTTWLWRDNPIISSGDLGWLPQIWTDLDPGVRQALGAEFLPVRDTNTLLDFKLWGERWAMHHGTNLVWYLLGCTLFLGICRRLLGAGLPAWLAAAWFTVHPVHTENIAWLASRKDLLALCFTLAAWWLWLVSRRKRWGLPLCLVLYVLAVWSKNTAIVLPAILVVCDLMLQQKHSRRSTRHWLAWACIAAPLVALSVQLGRDMHLFGEQLHLGLFDGLVLQVELWGRDLSHLIWPSKLAMIYPTPSANLSLDSAGSAALLLLAGTVAWGMRDRAPVISLGIVLFCVASMPTSVFMSLQNLAADRYLLLPSAGLALAAGGALKLGAARRPWLTGGALAGVSMLASVSTQTSQRWRSDVALWSASADNQPTVVRNHLQKAKALNADDQPEQALEALAHAEAQHGPSAQLLQGRGAVHFKRADLQSAEQDYRAALQLDPDLRISGNDLAIILARSGRLAQAITVAERVTQAHPRYAKGFNTLGALLLDARQLDHAERALLRAETLSLSNPSTACNLGGVYWLKLQTDPLIRPAAVEWWTICRARQPGIATPPGLGFPD